MNTVVASARPALRVPSAGTLAALASWPMAGATSFVFLSSLPYKFSGHPDTAHVFSTIGAWIGRGLGDGVGGALATALMAGAAFFHLHSPLGTTVVNDGVSDDGALFRAALTVLASGLVLVAANARSALRG